MERYSNSREDVIIEVTDNKLCATMTIKRDSGVIEQEEIISLIKDSGISNGFISSIDQEGEKELNQPFKIAEVQPINKEINIEESFAHFNNLKKHKKIKSQLSALFSKVFIREIINKPFIILSPRKLVSTMFFFSSAISIKCWFKDYLKDSEYLGNTILLYTYWCTSTTMGLGMATKNNKIKLISRVHGIDFYEERGSVFGRNETLKVTNKIYLASFAGREYLIKKYPKYANKIYFAGLGSVNPTFITRQSTDSIFRIVSCSKCGMDKIPVKSLLSSNNAKK